MIYCRFEDGKRTYLRHVTVDGLVIRSNRILLVRRSKESLVEPFKWALPGGFLDRDETAEEAVVREVLEETGYEAEVLSLFRIIHSPRLKGDDRQNVGFFFILRAFSQIEEPDEEVHEINWFKLSELPIAKLWGFDHFEQVELFQKTKETKDNWPIIN